MGNQQANEILRQGEKLYENKNYDQALEVFMNAS